MKQIQLITWGFDKTDKRLTWKQQINHMVLKLNKTNAMLQKLRHVLITKPLRSVYCAIFESYLWTKTYGRYSMFVNAIYVWNHLQNCHQNVILHHLRTKN